MLEKLTKAQEKEMIVVRDRWINQLNSCPRINKKEAEKWIGWLYELSGLKKPKVIFLDSPLACQYAANQVRGQVRVQVGGQVRGQVGDQVRGQVRVQVGGQVWDQVGDQVGGQVRVQVRVQVWDQVGDQVREKKLEFFSFCSYGDIDDYDWASFYDFFQDKVEISKEVLEKFNNFIFLLKSGIFTMIQFENYCFVSSMPKFIKRDDQNRLHSVNGSAIEFRDGFKLFYLHGISFKEDLFKKITRKNVTLKTILSLDDIDQRAAALKVYGIEKIVESENCKLIDESKRGNKLYLISNVFAKPVYYLGFTCPSTGKKYLEGVHDEVGKKESADFAQASALCLTLKEYADLKIES